MKRLYLGVDGGQSSTSALIADEQGHILGSGTSGPCNHVSGAEARSKFVSVLAECLSQACREAELSSDTVQFAAACLGFSGGPEDKQFYAQESIRSARFKITHDAEIALSGALSGEPGIMVIAGTGSMTFGRTASGITARAGGWGYLFGDEGGALYLVKEALRSCLRAEEGWGPPTQLTEALLSASNAISADKLMRYWYTIPRSEIAAYARVVTAQADQGDKAALAICHDAARQLAIYATGVARTLFANAEHVLVSYAGGVFQNSLIRQVFSIDCQALFHGVLTPPAYPPVAGALIEALRLDGNLSTPANLKASFK